jgi:hypothetical protein
MEGEVLTFEKILSAMAGDFFTTTLPWVMLALALGFAGVTLIIIVAMDKRSSSASS